MATIHGAHTWRVLLHMGSGNVVQDTRKPMGVERFNNARCNGQFQHPDLVVFEQQLVIFQRCGESVVFGFGGEFGVCRFGMEANVSSALYR